VERVVLNALPKRLRLCRLILCLRRFGLPSSSVASAKALARQREKAIHLLPCSKLCRGRKLSNEYNCGNGVPSPRRNRCCHKGFYGRLSPRRGSVQSADRKYNHFGTVAARGERLFSARRPGLSSSGTVHEEPTICVLVTRLGSGRP